MSTSYPHITEIVKETRDKIDRLYQPPPLQDHKYVIIDKKARANYYFLKLKVFTKRKQQLKEKYPTTYKERFEFIRR